MAQEQKQNQPQEQKPEIVDATIDEIFAVGCEIKKIPYDIPGIGRVYGHTISNFEAQLWVKSLEENDLYVDAKLIQYCIYDKNGQKLFKENHIPKIVTLREEIMAGLRRFCLEINGMGDIGTAAIVKNSKTTVTSDS